MEFILAGLLIGNMLKDWEENPTITTLDSIAAPIQEIPFPTVTVCPYEETEPDNWAYPELILNAVAFECYKDNYPPCNLTETVRQDLKEVLTRTADKIKRMLTANGFKGLLERDRTLSGSATGLLFGETSPTEDQLVMCLMQEKLLSFKEITRAFTDNFGKLDDGSAHTLHAALKTKIDYSQVEDVFYESDDRCCSECEDLMRLTNLHMEQGEVFLSTERNMALGRLLSNFITLARTKTFSYDVRLRDLERDATSGSLCKDLTSLDNLIHGYLANMSKVLGINATLSLFDIPSLLTKGHDYRKGALGPFAAEGFPYSMCQYQPSVMISSMDDVCFDQWHEYYELGTGKHPCDFKDRKPLCCHYLLEKINHNLTPLMKVMRVASRRGQNLLDMVDLLDPFLTNNTNGVRYPMNKIGIGHYHIPKVYDPTGYMRPCSFAEQFDSLNQINLTTDKSMKKLSDMYSCFMFQPVVTDKGICYACNAKSTEDLLKASVFKEAFMESYKSELETTDQRMGLGTGKSLSLFFVVDNNAMFRPWQQDKFDFKIGFGSSEETLQFSATSKLIRPGFALEYDVTPIQVVADPELRNILPTSRGCQFPEETEGFVDIFEEYSQPACQFECMLKYARNLCRCTPWNMPTPAGETSTIICDLYSVPCFDWAMSQRQRLKDCNCPVDCNAIKYSVVEKEIEINTDIQCGGFTDAFGRRGLFHPKKSFMSNDLLFTYYQLSKNPKLNKTWPIPINYYPDLCKQMLEENMAMIWVKFASNTYVKTVISKKVTFADQLGSLGMYPFNFLTLQYLSICYCFAQVEPLACSQE